MIEEKLIVTQKDLEDFLENFKKPIEIIIPVGQKTLEAFNKAMQEDYERRNSTK